MITWMQLLVTLFLILIAAQLFSNGLEHFAQRLGFSTGVTGSIFAAIATALPEATVPVLAIIAGTSDPVVNEEISVGAILGAPLMISTLSTFIMAISVLRPRNLHGRIAPERSGFARDLNFFLLSFCIATSVLFIPIELYWLRCGMSVILLLLYMMYVTLTIKASKTLVKAGHHVDAHEPLLLSKLGFNHNFTCIISQLVLALTLLLLGAEGFIYGVHALSQSLGISALLLSLLIIPLATELPEKVNSVLWVRKNKDTLGFSNLTGALVFQSTLLPAIGIAITPWQPNKLILLCVLVTLLAGGWLRYNASHQGLSIRALCLNGALYLGYLVLVFNYL